MTKAEQSANDRDLRVLRRSVADSFRERRHRPATSRAANPVMPLS